MSVEWFSHMWKLFTFERSNAEHNGKWFWQIVTPATMKSWESVMCPLWNLKHDNNNIPHPPDKANLFHWLNVHNHIPTQWNRNTQMVFFQQAAHKITPQTLRSYLIWIARSLSSYRSFVRSPHRSSITWQSCSVNFHFLPSCGGCSDAISQQGVARTASFAAIK